MRIFSDFIASDSLALVNFDELPGLFLLKNPPISWPYGTGVAEFSARSRRAPLGVLLDYTRIASVFGPLSVQPTHQHVLRLLVLVEYLKLCALPRSTLTPDRLALVLVDEKDALTTALRASSPSGTVATEPDYLVFTPKVYDLVQNKAIGGSTTESPVDVRLFDTVDEISQGIVQDIFSATQSQTK